MAFVRQISIEYDMTIKNTAYRVSYRIVHIISFDKYSVESRDASVYRSTRAFEHSRKESENRRGISAARGRFTRGESHFALRLGETRDRVKQQIHVVALITEIFGDGVREIRTAYTHHRRLIARRDHHH